ncbi:hypothetical protein ACWGKX_38775, partial [Streptomyces tricolor]
GYTLVTVFEPIGSLAGDSEGLGDLLADALPLAGRGAAVVLAGWGPPERCATSSVLRMAAKLADPLGAARAWRGGGPGAPAARGGRGGGGGLGAAAARGGGGAARRARGRGRARG